MIDGDSHQIYFSSILSIFILVHYIGLIVIYTTHPNRVYKTWSHKQTRVYKVWYDKYQLYN